MKNTNKLLTISAYLFFLPALYIVLTERRRSSFVGKQATSAFLLWLVFISLFFLLRLFINLIWANYYLAHLDKLELIYLLGGYLYIVKKGLRALYYDKK